jgi:ACS family hexuronate transporter-like MFS transporter
MTSIRWIILTLLFFATTINYIDRQVIGLLKPYIEKDLGWTEADYGYIVAAFQLAYAVGLLVSGRLLDKFGIRWGYTIAIFIWSLAAIMHAAVRSLFGFASARFALGVSESANFPACIKTVAEWFPVKDRALVTGIFNSGSSIGAITAPVIVTFVTLTFGWKWAFIVTGALGFIWIAFWLIFYDVPQKHRKVNQAELDYVLQDERKSNDHPVRWSTLLKYRQTYGICLSRLTTDWVWWFFLFWAPDFLKKSQNVDLQQSVLPLVLIYTLAGIGGIAGGAISSWFIQANRSVDYARKTAILISAILVMPLLLVTQVQNVWIAAGIIGLAAAAHSGFASNIFTITSDIYPKKAVATMVGMSGFAGAVGGAFSATFVGLILQWTHQYFIVFACASAMYLLTWGILKVFVPKIEPITLTEQQNN